MTQIYLKFQSTLLKYSFKISFSHSKQWSEIDLIIYLETIFVNWTNGITILIYNILARYMGFRFVVDAINW